MQKWENALKTAPLERKLFFSAPSASARDAYVIQALVNRYELARALPATDYTIFRKLFPHSPDAAPDRGKTHPGSGFAPSTAKRQFARDTRHPRDHFAVFGHW